MFYFVLPGRDVIAGPRLMLSQHEWDHTEAIVLRFQNSLLSLTTCDIAHQQTIPVHIEFGE